MHHSNATQAGNFRFVMSNDFKHTEFFATSFSGLGLSFNDAPSQNYFGHRVRRPGDELTFNDITLAVIMDEDFDVLEELYATLATGTRNVEESTINWNNIFNAVLHLSTNRNNINKRITFENCWVREMGDIEFNTTEAETSVVTVSVTLSFDSYSIESVE